LDESDVDGKNPAIQTNAVLKKNTPLARLQLAEMMNDTVHFLFSLLLFAQRTRIYQKSHEGNNGL
jgi:hypothetical protein